MTTTTLMYEGWQVWDGTYGHVRTGADFVASVEFVVHSRVQVVEPGIQPSLRQIEDNQYLAVAKVLDTTDAVVLDLGVLRALKWVRPGETADPFAPAITVAMKLSLSLNPWEDTPWTNRAAQLHSTNHRWRVHRIVSTLR